jgi:hypothetical protein
MPSTADHHRFFVKSEASLNSLAVWLEDRDFNEVFPFLKDKQGNRMIGLNMLFEAGKFERRGLIIVVEMVLLKRVVAMANAAMKKEITNG